MYKFSEKIFRNDAFPLVVGTTQIFGSYYFILPNSLRKYEWDMQPTYVQLLTAETDSASCMDCS